VRHTVVHTAVLHRPRNGEQTTHLAELPCRVAARGGYATILIEALSRQPVDIYQAGDGDKGDSGTEFEHESCQVCSIG